jgi:23S rRNA (pseudouridine1915-N3)-methyltransferase
VRLTLICLGHNQPRWVVEASEEYSKRFGRTWPFGLIEIKPEKRSEGRATEVILADEAQKIRAQIPRDAALVTLDERGLGLTSRALSEKLALTARDHAETVFIIGSADGLDAELKRSATWQWSLSPLTLPHGLARVVATEQLYRAISLLQGHPYHRD